MRKTDIIGLHEAHQCMEDFAFQKFSLMKEFHYVAEGAPASYRLDLVMETPKHPDTYRINIRFRGSSGLTVDGFDPSNMQISGFDIRNVSERGLESLRWEVMDFENGKIHFYCQSVEILSISKSHPL